MGSHTPTPIVRFQVRLEQLLKRLRSKSVTRKRLREAINKDRKEVKKCKTETSSSKRC